MLSALIAALTLYSSCESGSYDQEAKAIYRLYKAYFCTGEVPWVALYTSDLDQSNPTLRLSLEFLQLQVCDLEDVEGSPREALEEAMGYSIGNLTRLAKEGNDHQKSVIHDLMQCTRREVRGFLDKMICGEETVYIGDIAAYLNQSLGCKTEQPSKLCPYIKIAFTALEFVRQQSDKFCRESNSPPQPIHRGKRQFSEFDVLHSAENALCSEEELYRGMVRAYIEVTGDVRSFDQVAVMVTVRGLLCCLIKGGIHLEKGV